MTVVSEEGRLVDENLTLSDFLNNYIQLRDIIFAVALLSAKFYL